MTSGEAIIESSELPFSVVRKLGRLPLATFDTFGYLIDTLRNPKVLPSESHVCTTLNCQATFVPQQIIRQMLRDWELFHLEQVINDALPVSSRKTIPARALWADTLLPVQQANQPKLYRAVGVVLSHEAIQSEMKALARPLRNYRMPRLATLTLAEFPATPPEKLTVALQAIDMALPQGTELPLSPTEFVPYGRANIMNNSMLSDPV